MELLNTAASVEEGKLIVAKVDTNNREILSEIMEVLEENISSGVIFLGAETEDGKAALVCRITPDFVQKYGLHAGELIKRVAEMTGGSGGGRPDFAQAGGKNPEKLDQAVEFAKKNIAHQMAK